MIEQTKTRPQETLGYEMNKKMQTFSINPLVNLVGECNWLLGVTSLECKNSVFNISDETNSFGVTILGHWATNLAEKTIDELNNILELRSQSVIELQVEQSRKKDTFKKGLLLILSCYIQKRNAWRIKKCKPQWYWRYGI